MQLPPRAARLFPGREGLVVEDVSSESDRGQGLLIYGEM